MSASGTVTVPVTSMRSAPTPTCNSGDTSTRASRVSRARKRSPWTDSATVGPSPPKPMVPSALTVPSPEVALASSCTWLPCPTSAARTAVSSSPGVTSATRSASSASSPTTSGVVRLPARLSWPCRPPSKCSTSSVRRVITVRSGTDTSMVPDSGPSARPVSASPALTASATRPPAVRGSSPSTVSRLSCSPAVIWPASKPSRVRSLPSASVADTAPAEVVTRRLTSGWPSRMRASPSASMVPVIARSGGSQGPTSASAALLIDTLPVRSLPSRSPARHRRASPPVRQVSDRDWICALMRPPAVPASVNVGSWS